MVKTGIHIPQDFKKYVRNPVFTAVYDILPVFIRIGSEIAIIKILQKIEISFKYWPFIKLGNDLCVMVLLFYFFVISLTETFHLLMEFFGAVVQIAAVKSIGGKIAEFYVMIQIWERARYVFLLAIFDIVERVI